MTIFVDDNGVGIPENKLEEVFRPFYRLDDARNAQTGGTGLGLAIARDVARGHGGDIVCRKVLWAVCARKSRCPYNQSSPSPSSGLSSPILANSPARCGGLRGATHEVNQPARVAHQHIQCASVVPPGEVTLTRNCRGSASSSRNMEADPIIVCIANCAAMSCCRPRLTPAAASASTI